MPKYDNGQNRRDGVPASGYATETRIYGTDSGYAQTNGTSSDNGDNAFGADASANSVNTADGYNAFGTDVSTSGTNRADATMANAIEVRNLCKSYKGFTMKNVSFSVPEGYVCGFVGPNGAGKTTVLKCLLGMAMPDSGEMTILGAKAGFGGSDAVKSDIGVMFDIPIFHESWTAAEIAKLLGPFYKNWDNGLFMTTLKNVGLDPNKKFKSFSRGMKQKLSMSVMLAHRPRLLLLDEPTGGLDPAARDAMLDTLRDFMAEDTRRSILFSTHITEDLSKIADKIVYISGGRVVFDGLTDELREMFAIVRGGNAALDAMPREKLRLAKGLRKSAAGFECLMRKNDIGGLPQGTVAEEADIDDVIVFNERGGME
jgi:ABC-2 type transport system ATP-binding protein